jgi:hypothetical protein
MSPWHWFTALLSVSRQLATISIFSIFEVMRPKHVIGKLGQTHIFSAKARQI